MISIIRTLSLAALPICVVSQVVGTPFGFASDVTGGGDATPAVPADIDELVSWLGDDTPRVIVLDKIFDFTGSEGTTTAQVCYGYPCDDGGGQYVIEDSCDGNTWVEATYDNAGLSAITVGSNKSLIGKGSDGVLKGKGLVVADGASNVIIQNIHITEINPQFVWGGDALLLDGADRVWIDHNKFSLVGRQFFVTGFEKAGHVTLSWNEFDGVTDYSASCNGQHYWVMLLAGAEDYYTIANNYIHDTSGRGPHMGTTVDVSTMYVHAYNNLWSNVGGHAFDIDDQTWTLLEGNVFSSVDTPMTDESETNGGAIYDVSTDNEASQCDASIGRTCILNEFDSSGTWPDIANSDALTQLSNYAQYLTTPSAASEVADVVMAGAGIGKI